MSAFSTDIKPPFAFAFVFTPFPAHAAIFCIEMESAERRDTQTQSDGDTMPLFSSISEGPNMGMFNIGHLRQRTSQADVNGTGKRQNHNNQNHQLQKHKLAPRQPRHRKGEEERHRAAHLHLHLLHHLHHHHPPHHSSSTLNSLLPLLIPVSSHQRYIYIHDPVLTVLSPSLYPIPTAPALSVLEIFIFWFLSSLARLIGWLAAIPLVHRKLLPAILQDPFLTPIFPPS